MILLYKINGEKHIKFFDDNLNILHNLNKETITVSEKIEMLFKMYFENKKMFLNYYVVFYSANTDWLDFLTKFVYGDLTSFYKKDLNRLCEDMISNLEKSINDLVNEMYRD